MDMVPPLGGLGGWRAEWERACERPTREEEGRRRPKQRIPTDAGTAYKETKPV